MHLLSSFAGSSGIYQKVEINPAAVIAVLILLYRCGIAAYLPLRTMRGSPSDRRILHLHRSCYLSSASQTWLFWQNEGICLISSSHTLSNWYLRYFCLFLSNPTPGKGHSYCRQTLSKEACKKSERWIFRIQVYVSLQMLTFYYCRMLQLLSASNKLWPRYTLSEMYQKGAGMPRPRCAV